MNQTTIRDTVKMQPFKPFAIRTVDGRVYRINGPDHVAISPTLEIVIVFDVDHYYVLDADKITALEVLP
jgi:hypothetical protein